MPVKILIVGSSENERAVMEKALSDYCVLAACDGAEAMRLADTHEDIALIILDIGMQDTDCLQFIGALNSNPRYGKLRTIILTDTNESETGFKEFIPGVVDYIRKPIRKEALKAKIRLHTELYEQQTKGQMFDERSLILNSIFYQAPIGIAISYGETAMTDGNELVSINPMYEQITGRTYDELIKLGWAKITHPDDLKEDLENYKKLISGEIKSYSMEKRYIRPDGSVVWVYMVAARIAMPNRYKFGHICLVQDITKRKETEESLAESERSKTVLLSHLPGMAYRCKYDRDWTMQYVSEGCFELTGYTADNLLYNRDLSFNDLIAPEYRELLWNEWKRILAGRLPFKYEYEIITGAGERKWVLELGQGIYGEKGEVEALEGIILDISDRKRIENNLRYNNEHDIWTGLYNRRYLENLLRHDAKMNPAQKRAVVSVNLSSVHFLSMTYGFHYSQELIKRIAAALMLHCNENRRLFNTFENRFVFYVKDYKNKEELTAFCEAVIETLESLLAAERIGGGIGVVEIDGSNMHDVEQLLKTLLITSEKAISIFDRDLGYCFFDTDMEKEILREEEIKLELAQIAAGESNERFFLQYQPILDLGTGRICGFEALARLESDKLGPVPPSEFIPVAEKTKLIIPVGKEIILRVLRFLDMLKTNGYDTICVWVNVSAIQLLRKDFSKNLFDMLDEMRIDPANIGLEITESVFASNYQEINAILGELKDSGIKIAIDDFGTGYSSLARVQEINSNCLKIDKHFIDRLLTLSDEKAVIGDIISMAHKLGCFVIAEGVEQQRQREYLKRHGCDKIQGYLISRPLDEEAALKTLGKQTGLNVGSGAIPADAGQDGMVCEI